MSTRIRSSFVAGGAAFAVLLLCDAAGAAAQESEAASTARNTLTVEASVTQAYDEDVPAEIGGIIDPGHERPSGHSTMLAGGIGYLWQQGTMQGGASVASSARYYGSAGEFRATRHSGSVGLSAGLTRRTMFFLNQTASYSPSYLYGLFPHESVSGPGALPPVAPDYFIDDSESFSHGTTLAVTQGLSRRSSLSVSGDVSRTRFLQESARGRDLRTYGIAGRYSYSLTRNTSLLAGYRYRAGEFGFGTSLESASTEHAVEAGLSFSRPLSAVTRVTFDGTLGSALVTVPAQPGVSGGDVEYRQLMGQGAVSYQLSRSWVVRGSYRRGVELVAGLAEPLLADSAAASVNGFITPKLEVFSSVGYSSGGSALDVNDLLFDSYSGNVRMRYALNGTFWLTAEYLVYYYEFRDGLLVAPGAPAGLTRNGVRAGLAMRLPLMR